MIFRILSVSFVRSNNISYMSDFRLKAFYSVARNLSFTKASQELFVSQPAITKHIRELESLYGVRLFDRRGNTISLTRAGELLMEHCGRILAEYRKLEYDMHLLNNECVGELRLGASTTISHYVLPQILAAFTEKYPKMRVSLIDTNSRNVEKALQEHRIDIGMIEGVFRAPSLHYESFLCDELVPVTSAKSHLASKNILSVDEFKSIPLVLREHGSGTLDAIESVLSENGIKVSSLNVRMTLGSTESIKSFLKCSDCLGIVSLSALESELRDGTFTNLEIEGLQFKRNFCFVTEQGEDSEPVTLFVRFMQKYIDMKNRRSDR